ncbi:MAG TPA: FAD-dependent oxidoreductase [Ktedonobacteraceae bacterium]|nr:FAD-dependent oxidoreductase [Ktedonobacteraceae bacterium]
MQRHEGLQRAHEPGSYWQRGSAPMVFSEDLPTSVDTVVIGGGFFGTATAYWLACAGVSVALLERTSLAYGATGRNGGFVMSGTAESYTAVIARLGHETALAISKITIENRQLLRQVLAEEALSCDYREPGNLNLALNEVQLAARTLDVKALQADGFRAELLDRQQVQAMIDTPIGSEIAGGVYIPEQGLVHSAHLVQELARAAQRRGASMHIAKVLKLRSNGDGVRIETTRGVVQAGAVVVALNAWTGELVPALAEYIVPVRGQVLAYQPSVPVFKMGIGADVTATGEYWQQALDGTIVLGGCREVAADQDVGVRNMQPDENVQAAIEQVLPRLFPSLSNLIVAQRWAGLMAFTRDYLPIVDHVPGIERAWFMGGFCGHGMPFGMRFGQLLAEAVRKGEQPVALQPFGLQRETLSWRSIRATA